MTPPVRTIGAAPELRRARLGVTLLFMTNGMIWANLAPRYPEIRRSLALSYGQFGLAVMFGGLGAIAFGLTAAAVIRRFTSRLVGVTFMILMAVGALLAVLAPNGIIFAIILFSIGAIDSVVDVAQNAHGLRVQRAYGRTIINSFHAMWSVGAVVGGIMGGIAAGRGVPLGAHLAVVALLVALVNVAGYRMLLVGADPVSPHTGSAHARAFPKVAAAIWVVLGLLSIVAIAGAWVEDAAISWSASYLRDELSAGATVASFGFVALMAMHFVGRVIGDRFIERFGAVLVTRVGGLITAVGMGTALLWPSIPMTVIGFGLAGLGVATSIPAAMHAADELPGFRSGTGLTIVSWALRVGFMLSPVVVGAVADATSLRVGLALVVVAGLVLALFASAMTPRSLAGAEEPEPAP